MDVTFVAVARPEHPLFAVGHELSFEDLDRHVQVVVRDSGVKHPRDEGWLGAERRCTVSSMEASLATVKAGLAYAWLPEHVVAESLRNGSSEAAAVGDGAGAAGAAVSGARAGGGCGAGCAGGGGVFSAAHSCAGGAGG